LSGEHFLYLLKPLAGRVAQAVKYLPSKHEALISNPSTTKKQNQNNNKKPPLSFSGYGTRRKKQRMAKDNSDLKKKKKMTGQVVLLEPTSQNQNVRAG
jgi:hypothetical protein